MKPAPALADDLGFSDRREVIRAVRYGRAVDDPTLAPAAIAHARHVQRLAERWTLRTPAGWPSLVGEFVKSEGWMLIVPMLVLLVWIHDPVTIAVEGFIVFVFARMLVRYTANAPALANQAEVANRALVGDPIRPTDGEAARSPWWRPRGGVPRSKPEVAGWLPIPLWQLVPIWVAWAGVVVTVGVTVRGAVQDWLPFVYLLVWIEVERRLAEPVEQRLGLEAARRARGYDVFRSGRGWPWSALFVLLLAAIGAMSVGIAASGWFKGQGLGAGFGFTFLLIYVYRDLASRWRWLHATG